MLVKYDEGYTFFAEVDMAEWEGQLGHWEEWKAKNGWVPASEPEKLRAAMVAPVYRVRTTYEGRAIVMWAIR